MFGQFNLFSGTLQRRGCQCGSKINEYPSAWVSATRACWRGKVSRTRAEILSTVGA